MFPPAMRKEAEQLLDLLRRGELRLTTAESCTGGLIAALLTELPGSSDVLERGYVAYSNAAKHECLGVPTATIDAHGAVSAAVACAMAEGALRQSHSDIAVSVTGLAGPHGGTDAKPVGLVHIAVAHSGRQTSQREYRFGNIGRDQVRAKAVEAALSALRQCLGP